MAIPHDLVTQVMALSADDMRHLNKMMLERLKANRRIENAMAAISFNRGDRVRFDHSKRGMVYEGTIVQQNRTTFTVKVEGAGLWRVPPSMLTKVGA